MGCLSGSLTNLVNVCNWRACLSHVGASEVSTGLEAFHRYLWHASVLPLFIPQTFIRRLLCARPGLCIRNAAENELAIPAGGPTGSRRDTGGMSAGREVQLIWRTTRQALGEGLQDDREPAPGVMLREGGGRMCQQREQLAGGGPAAGRGLVCSRGSRQAREQKGRGYGRSGSPTGRQAPEPRKPAGPSCSSGRAVAPGVYLPMITSRS